MISEELSSSTLHPTAFDIKFKCFFLLKSESSAMIVAKMINEHLERAVKNVDSVTLKYYLEKVAGFLRSNRRRLIFPDVSFDLKLLLKRLVLNADCLLKLNIKDDCKSLIMQINHMKEQSKKLYVCVLKEEVHNDVMVLVYFKDYLEKPLEQLRAPHLPASKAETIFKNYKENTKEVTAKINTSFKVKWLNATLKFIKDDTSMLLCYPEMSIPEGEFVYSMVMNQKYRENTEDSGSAFRSLHTPLSEALKIFGSKYEFKMEFVATRNVATVQLNLEKKLKTNVTSSSSSSSRNENPITLPAQKPNLPPRVIKKSNADLTESLDYDFKHNVLVKILDFLDDDASGSIVFAATPAETKFIILAIQRKTTLHTVLKKQLLALMNRIILRRSELKHLHVVISQTKINPATNMREVILQKTPSFKDRAESIETDENNAKKCSPKNDLMITINNQYCQPTAPAIDNAVKSKPGFVVDGQVPKRIKKLMKDLSVPVQSDRAMKMMKVMGWEGGSLGVRGGGITEPIQLSLRGTSKAGLGHVAKPTKASGKQAPVRASASCDNLQSKVKPPSRSESLSRLHSRPVPVKNSYVVKILAEMLDFIHSGQERRIMPFVLSKKGVRFARLAVDLISSGRSLPHAGPAGAPLADGLRAALRARPGCRFDVDLVDRKKAILLRLDKIFSNGPGFMTSSLSNLAQKNANTTATNPLPASSSAKKVASETQNTQCNTQKEKANAERNEHYVEMSEKIENPFQLVISRINSKQSTVNSSELEITNLNSSKRDPELVSTGSNSLKTTTDCPEPAKTGSNSPGTSTNRSESLNTGLSLLKTPSNFPEPVKTRLHSPETTTNCSEPVKTRSNSPGTSTYRSESLNTGLPLKTPTNFPEPLKTGLNSPESTTNCSEPMKTGSNSPDTTANSSKPVKTGLNQQDPVPPLVSDCGLNMEVINSAILRSQTPGELRRKLNILVKIYEFVISSERERIVCMDVPIDSSLTAYIQSMSFRLNSRIPLPRASVEAALCLRTQQAMVATNLEVYGFSDRSFSLRKLAKSVDDTNYGQTNNNTEQINSNDVNQNDTDSDTDVILIENDLPIITIDDSERGITVNELMTPVNNDVNAAKVDSSTMNCNNSNKENTGVIKENEHTNIERPEVHSTNNCDTERMQEHSTHVDIITNDHNLNTVHTTFKEIEVLPMSTCDSTCDSNEDDHLRNETESLNLGHTTSDVINTNSNKSNPKSIDEIDSIDSYINLLNEGSDNSAVDKIEDEDDLLNTSSGSEELLHDIKDLENIVSESSIEVKKENQDAEIGSSKRSWNGSNGSFCPFMKKTKIDANNIKTVAIVHESPNKMINREKAKELQDFISRKIDLNQELPILKCHGLKDGTLLYSCLNEDSYEWLRNTFSVANVKILEVSNAFVEEKSKLSLKINSFSDINTKLLFQRLELYNEGLKTNNWNVFKTVKNIDNIVINVEIDDISLELIKQCNFTLYAGVDAVECSILWD